MFYRTNDQSDFFNKYKAKKENDGRDNFYKLKGFTRLLTIYNVWNKSDCWTEKKKINIKKIYEKNSRQIPIEGKTIYLTSTLQNYKSSSKKKERRESKKKKKSNFETLKHPRRAYGHMTTKVVSWNEILEQQKKER